MMRLEGGGAAAMASPAAASASPIGAAASTVGSGAGAMSMSQASLSASVSSDFLGNQLATYFSQLFEKGANPNDPNAQR